jgi:anti-sigma regulatory factor (Ser/Thr protein kinase)
MTWDLSFHLDSGYEAMRAARRMVYAIVKQEGMSEENSCLFGVAVAEALGNAVKLASPPGVPRSLTLDLTRSADAFEVTLHNQGKPVTRPTVPASLPHRSEGGQGLYLLSRLVDQVTIGTNSKGSGISITMRKKFPDIGGQ